MTTFTTTSLVLSFVLFAACDREVGNPGPALRGEIPQLIETSDLPPRFLSYRANFYLEKRSFAFYGKNGPYQDSIWVIRDGEKYVALYFPQDKPYLDVFASDPEFDPFLDLRFMARGEGYALFDDFELKPIGGPQVTANKQ